ncbi:MAG: MTH938/NDUFAF3 family protein [Pseudomonadota bacterium]
MAEQAARYPYRAPIDAYGNGGFRFAGMSHKGSLLCLPSGIHAWAAGDTAGMTLSALAPALAEAGGYELLLLGTGREQVFPDPEVRLAFAEAGIGLEVMGTGAAARTYNVLLAEGRSVAAALIAVV